MSSVFGPQETQAVIAAVAVPRFRVAFGSGANYGGPATGPTVALIGIAQNDCLANDHMTVAYEGKSRAFCSSAVTPYQRITASASAGVMPLGVASGDNHVCIGYALQAGAPGDLISVMLQQPFTAGAV